MGRLVRTRAQWAAHIRATHKATIAACVEAILKLGRALAAAKKALPHGTFLKMIDNDLPFTASTAQRLMAIAADPKMSKAAHAQHLPAAWPTLYELTRLLEETFAQAVSVGAIHPRMTRKDASRIVRVQTKYTQRSIAPYYVTQPEEPLVIEPHYRAAPDEPEEIESEEPTLLEKVERLETLVAEVSADVKREGGIVRGSVAARRITALADQLLSLVERHEAATAAQLQ
jgi:phage tail protein X